MRFSFLLALALPCVTAQLLGVGQACTSNTECDTRLCDVPALGPGDQQCLARPAVDTQSCDKAQEATDCISGYCDEALGTCQPRPSDPSTTSPCTNDDACGTSQFCYDGNCLDMNLGAGSTCIVNMQCGSSPGEQICTSGRCTMSLLGVGESCTEDGQCSDKLCDFRAGDPSQKVCLEGAGRPLNAQCDVDRQCASSYCRPSTTAGESGSCSDRDTTSSETEPVDPSTSSSTPPAVGPSPSNNGGNAGPSSSITSGGGSGGSTPAPERVTITSVSNGQTVRVTSTRAAASVRASPSSAAQRLAPGWLGFVALVFAMA